VPKPRRWTSARVTHYPAVKKASATSCTRHRQTRIFRNFSARHVVNARFRAPFHYRLIKKRFVAAGRRTTRGNTWLWSSRYSRRITVIRDATWQACLSKRFFPLLSPRPGHGLQLPRDSNTSIHSATSYSSSAPALSLYCPRFDYIRRRKVSKKSVALASSTQDIEITFSKKLSIFQENFHY